MKKNQISREMASLNRAAFLVDLRALQSEALLEQLLSEVVGGTDPLTTSCTEFTCQLYAPPPPPKE